MALGPLIFFAVLALVHHPLLVNDHTDLATLERLQKQEKVLQKEMGHLQMELEQKSWSWDPSRSREDVVTPDLATEDGTWDGWHYVALVILILFGCCRQTMEKEPSYDSSTDSASTTTTEEFDDTDLESDHSESKEKMLDAFYHKHIQAETGDLGSLCDFVEAFVNDLVDACRGALPYQNTLPPLENCIGVGSAFEGWHVQKGCQAFSVLVPMVPPKGHFFSIETNDSEEVLSKHGHILVETECMCKRERLLGDVVCFLHHPQQELSQDMQGAYIMPVLCTSSHLDVDKTIHWFQKLVGKAWRSISPKFNLTLTPQASRTTCRLKLAFRSGRSIFIDIILGVQQGDSLVFLSSHGTETDNSTGTIWVKTFAVQELLFFKWASQRMPEDSCHLKCLQLIIYFRESNSSSAHPTVLLNYHYKTCLMHLLLLRPLSEWGPENMASRIQDVLLFMNTALQEKYLEHFLIGNISLPIQIPVPKALRSADPLNLFAHLAQDPKLHAKAKKEFEVVLEQVRNLFSEHEE